MLIENHYLKQKSRWGDKLIGEAESSLFSIIPDNTLVTAEFLAEYIRLAKRYVPAKFEGVPDNVNTIKPLLKSLAERGFLRELLGVSIDKFLDVTKK